MMSKIPKIQNVYKQLNGLSMVLALLLFKPFGRTSSTVLWHFLRIGWNKNVLIPYRLQELTKWAITFFN